MMVIVFAGETESQALSRTAKWRAERKELLGYQNGTFVLRGCMCVDQPYRDHAIEYRRSAQSVSTAENEHRLKLSRERPSLISARARRESRTAREFFMLLNHYSKGGTTYPLIPSLTRTPPVDRQVSDTWPFKRGDLTAPALVSIAIDVSGTTAELTYDERLDANSVPAASAYVLTGTSAAAIAVNIVAKMDRGYRRYVQLTLSPPAQSGETITLDYTPPSYTLPVYPPPFSGPIRDAARNDAAAFAAHAVTNGSAV